MAVADADNAQELTNIILALQHTILNVRQKISKDQQDFVFDSSQPIGHLLDTSTATDILSLAKPASEQQADLTALQSQLSTLQNTLEQRNQWHPSPTPTPIPCSTDSSDLSDLSTAVSLIADVVKYSDPSTALTPQKAFAARHWTWDPLWREFCSHDAEGRTCTYLSRWRFDPAREMWSHVNMAGSGLLPDEAQMRLGCWDDWRWDAGCGEWGLDVSAELDEEGRKEGERVWVFASRWREREGVWVYVGARGGG